LRDLLEDNSAPKNLPLSKKLYDSFMDVDRLEELGVMPVVALIEEVSALQTWGDFKQWTKKTYPRLHALPISAGVYNDLDSPDLNTLHINQSGLFLPDESYYKAPEHQEVRQKYTERLQLLLDEFIIDGKIYGDAKALDAFCAKIAAHHWDVAKNRDVDLSHNPMKFESACELGKNLELEGYFDIDPNVVVDVSQPDFIENVAKMWQEEFLDDWKNWAVCLICTHYASLLNSKVDDLSFDLRKIFSGAKVQRERYKRAVSLTNLVGDELGKVYVERYFDGDSRLKMQEMIDFLIKAYHTSIKNATWLSSDTKDKALDKLSKFDAQIGFPKHWHSYSELEFTDDLITNIDKASEFHFADDIAKVGEKVDRLLWHMTPQTVNAYYNPPENVIVFPAAILQPPFFDATRNSAQNYGGIGAVIGHEIGHGFDDQGAKYSGTGELEDWWTSDDKSQFEALTKRLNAQFEGFTPLQLAKDKDAPHVNGKLTTGENVGDLSGIKIALLAYALSRGVYSIEALVDIDVDAVREFFYSYATIWRSKTRDEYARVALAVDQHSPAEFRANTVRNLDAFHAAFETKPGDRLYLAPDARIDIW
jgi:putative endopeptidase